MGCGFGNNCIIRTFYKKGFQVRNKHFQEKQNIMEPITILLFGIIIFLVYKILEPEKSTKKHIYKKIIWKK